MMKISSSGFLQVIMNLIFGGFLVASVVCVTIIFFRVFPVHVTRFKQATTTFTVSTLPLFLSITIVEVEAW